MKEKQFKILFMTIFSTFLLNSCNQKQEENKAFDYYDNKFNVISSYAANTKLKSESDSSISDKDFFDRTNNCAYSNPELQNEVKSIVEAYNNKNLLNISNSVGMPAIEILTKTRELTSSSKVGQQKLYSCYYPELYIANAYILNILQKIPFSPFNQEYLMINGNKDDPNENENWNNEQSIKNSKIAKLNGIIRSSLLAEKIAESDEGEQELIPRIFSQIGDKKVFLFGMQDKVTKMGYYNQISSLAGSLAAIGYYERAMFRWNGVFTAEELSAHSILPNDSLQRVLPLAIENLPEPYRSKYTSAKTLSIKNIIANDLIMADNKSKIALRNSFCNKNSNAENMPAHMINMCSNMMAIKERAFNIDLKRLICTNGSKIIEPKSPDDLIFNSHWDAANCDNFINSNPSLINAYLDANGSSYSEIFPSSLNPFLMNENIEFMQKRFDELKSNISKFAILQTQDYENKKKEIADNISTLEENLSIAKKSQNKAAEELAYQKFQKETAEALLNVSNGEVEEILLEQKKQFRIYLSNIANIKSIQSLKDILDKYSENKKSLLMQYNRELCGSDNVKNCGHTGSLGKLTAITKEKNNAIINDWKIDCNRLVRQLNDTKSIIGSNGCDLSSLTSNVNFSTDLNAINLKIAEIIRNNYNLISPSCNAGVVSESMARLRNKTLQDASLNSSEKEINDALKKYYQDESSQLDRNSSASNPSYGSSIKNDVNYARLIKEMNTEKIYLEQVLWVNSGNVNLLAEPEKYCIQLLEDSQKTESALRPKITALLDNKIMMQNFELQKLQIIHSLDQEGLDFDVVTKEKIMQLDIQLENISEANKNIETILGLSQQFISIIKNSFNILGSDLSFEEFYLKNIGEFNYIPAKNAKSRKIVQENQLKNSEQNIKIGQENFEIYRMQVANNQSAIERARLRAQSQNNEFFLFTSISPNLTSYTSDIWQIDYVRELAKQSLRSASIKILNAPAHKRELNDPNRKFLNIIHMLSNTKYSCSYLASFDDAQHCLISLKALQEQFSFKNENNFGKVSKDLFFKIYSSDLRKKRKIRTNMSEQLSDDLIITQLNSSGLANLKIDEEYLKIKKILPERFKDDYYRSRIIGITVNIIQDNPVEEFEDYPFDDTNNIVYLMHDGIDKKDSPFYCSTQYENFSNKIYSEYLNEINALFNKDIYSNLGKKYPYLFSVSALQEVMCGKLQSISSSASSLPRSLIRYKNANNMEQPISLFSAQKFSESSFFVRNKIASFVWLDELKSAPLSYPTEADGYWQPVVGYLTNSSSTRSKLNQLSSQIFNCMISSDFDSSNCAIARKSSYQSFAGFPLLGSYSFAYAKHVRDQLVNKDTDKESEKTKIKGIEINFITSM